MIDPRKRISTRLNRARLTLEVKRSLRPLFILMIGAAIAAGGFFYIYDNIGAGAGGKRTYSFAANDTTGLVAGRAEVRFKGIHAGIVRDVEMKDGQAVIKTSLLDEFGKVYKDAKTEIRPNTPLQDMYLDIVDRGTPAAGEASESEPVPASNSQTSVNVSAVLNTFDGRTRERMRGLLSDLGHGLDDGGGRKLRQAFVELTPFVRVLGDLSDQLALRSKRTRRMVHNVGQLTKVLAEREGSLRGLIRDGNRTLRATTEQRPGLDGMLRELPGALRELDTSFATLDGVLPDLDRAVARLDPVAEELTPGLAALESVSKTARPAVRRLHKPLGDLLPLARQLRPMSSNLSLSAARLEPQMGNVAQITEDLKGCPAAAYMFFQWGNSIMKFEDGYGVYVRGDGNVGATSLAGLTSPTAKVRQGLGCARGKIKENEP